MSAPDNTVCREASGDPFVSMFGFDGLSPKLRRIISELPINICLVCVQDEYRKRTNYALGFSTRDTDLLPIIVDFVNQELHHK